MTSTSDLNSSNAKYRFNTKLQNGDKSISQMHDEKQKSIELSQDQKERELSLKKYELALYKRDIEYKEKELKFKVLQFDFYRKHPGQNKVD
jgi:hypothetical protein